MSEEADPPTLVNTFPLLLTIYKKITLLNIDQHPNDELNRYF